MQESLLLVLDALFPFCLSFQSLNTTQLLLFCEGIHTDVITEEMYGPTQSSDLCPAVPSVVPETRKK